MVTAVVLSGGANLGAVQVGMLRALVERGVRPDLVVGTSVGAVNGAYIAGRWHTDGVVGLGEVWIGLRRAHVFPARPLGGFIGFMGRRDHLLPADGLRRLLQRHVPEQLLEDFEIPLRVVATDVRSGSDRCLVAGPTVDAVLASSAIPGVFPPVTIEGRQYVDGGVIDNTPISHAVAAGATTVWVLPAGFACGLPSAPRGALAMALHAVNLLVNRRLQLDIERFQHLCDLHVLPPLCPVSVSPTDFGHARELMQRSHQAAGAWLDSDHPGIDQAALLDHGHA